jgi:hypothetical protein
MNEIILRRDSNGILNLGEIGGSVSTYRLTLEQNGRIVLDPCIEIPLEDKDSLKMIKQKHHLKKAA